MGGAEGSRVTGAIAKGTDIGAIIRLYINHVSICIQLYVIEGCPTVSSPVSFAGRFGNVATTSFNALSKASE